MISLSDKLIFQEFATAADRLIHLDQHWTEHAAQSASEESERRQLSTVTQDMDACLVRIADSCEALSAVSQKNQKAFAAGVTRLSDPRLSHFWIDGEAMLRRRGLDYSDGSLRKVLSDIQRAIPVERSELAAKNRIIQEKAPTQGDIGRQFACNIGAGLVVGGLLTGDFFAFGAGLAVGIIYACP